MKHLFDLDNFESFLSEQVDRHRMYASDKVWQNIQESLHGKGRWSALTFAALLTTSLLAVILTISYPKKLVQPDEVFNPEYAYDLTSSRKVQKEIKTSVVKAPEKNHSLLAQSYLNQTNDGVQEPEDVAVIVNAFAMLDEESSPAEILIDAETLRIEENTGESKAATRQTKELDEHIVPVTSVEASEEKISQNFFAGLLESDKKQVAVEFTADPGFPKTGLYQPNSISANNFAAKNPAKINSSLNVRNAKWALMFYATPSVSYRYLLEDKKYDQSLNAANGPIAPYLTNSVNEFVRHEPKLGLEAGAVVLYKLADNFRVKTGIQMNYRQYGIEAYQTSFAQPALLTLNSGNRVDSIVQYSHISNQDGYKSLQLTTNSLQLAIPLGFDMKFAQTKKVDFYFSASGQFTYQLDGNKYILSSDYKNYLRFPTLDRKFNINTAIEAFASFKAGGIHWQAGPQIRYQLLPGTTDAYPIREHLIDYGFKVGVVKPLR